MYKYIGVDEKTSVQTRVPSSDLSLREFPRNLKSDAKTKKIFRFCNLPHEIAADTEGTTLRLSYFCVKRHRKYNTPVTMTDTFVSLINNSHQSNQTLSKVFKEVAQSSRRTIAINSKWTDSLGVIPFDLSLELEIGVNHFPLAQACVRVSKLSFYYTGEIACVYEMRG